MKKIFLLLALVFLSACDELNGTDTGNPANPPASGITSGDTSSAVFLVVSTACSQVASCHGGADATLCMSESSSVTTFGVALGLSGADLSLSLDQIYLKERNGEMTPDVTATNTCTSDISALSCGAQEVQDSYDTNLANPYEKLSLMLPASCTGVF